MSKRPWLVFVLFAVFVLMVGAACSASAGDTPADAPTAGLIASNLSAQADLRTAETGASHEGICSRRSRTFRDRFERVRASDRESFHSTRLSAGHWKKPIRMC